MANQDAHGQSSSPDMDTDVNASASSPGEDVNAPQSSSGEEPVSERDGLLEAVKSVVPDGEEGSPDATESADPSDPDKAPDADTGEGEKGSEDADAEPPEVTEEELKAYTPNARKRIEGLVRERNELRETVQSLEQDAGYFREFQGYLQQNSLANEEVNQLLQIGATLKRGDLRAFHDMIAPYYRIAAEASGHQLPDDLRKQVDEGYVTENLAREIAVNRAQAATLQAQVAQRDEQAAMQAQTQSANAIRSHVAAWETQVRQSDPDYSLKADLVQAYARGIVQERGRPQTPQQAVEWTKEAYSMATDKLKSLRPTPQPTRQAPGGINTPTAARPEPRSLEEAIKLGLQNAAGQ